MFVREGWPGGESKFVPGPHHKNASVKFRDIEERYLCYKLVFNKSGFQTWQFCLFKGVLPSGFFILPMSKVKKKGGMVVYPESGTLLGRIGHCREPTPCLQGMRYRSLKINPLTLDTLGLV